MASSPIHQIVTSAKSEGQQIRLRWSSHAPTLSSEFAILFEKGLLLDLSIVAEGKIVRAHKLVLSASSPYFQKLLTSHNAELKDPIIFLTNVRFSDLNNLLTFIYCGHVCILPQDLPSLLKVAEDLQIRGLFDENRTKEVILPQSPVGSHSSSTNSNGRLSVNSRTDYPHSNGTNRGNGNYDDNTSAPFQDLSDEVGSENGKLDDIPESVIDTLGMDSEKSHCTDIQCGHQQPDITNMNVDKFMETDLATFREDADNREQVFGSTSSWRSCDNNPQSDLILESNNGMVTLSMASIKTEQTYSDPPDLPIGSDPFKCGKCGKKYTSNKSLWRHRKFACAHGWKQSFSCRICGKRFSRSDNLRRHSVVAHCAQ